MYGLAESLAGSAQTYTDTRLVPKTTYFANFAPRLHAL